MTSQINPNNIDGSFPVAGQDNDSQGFRDNFTNIRNNFTFSKAELEDLQNKVVLKSALLNTTLDNDFAGNAISNPTFTSWRETYNDIGSPGSSVTIDFTNGNFQKFTMSSSTTMAFSFPANTNNQYASIKVWVVNTNSSWTLTLPGSVSLNDPLSIGGASGSPVTITFTSTEISNNTNYFFEFFTVNGGTAVGIRDLTRNRDIGLNALAVSGAFSANGTVTLGSSTNDTTITGNLITAGGTINTDYAYVTLTNGQNFFANSSYNTLYLDTASSDTIANARIALPDTEVDGREITLSFLAPITSVWVNKGNTALVKWFPNTTVSSGNVSAKFTYSVANSNWLRS